MAAVFAIRWPYGAVETAPIDERDIAAVAVRALSEASLALSHARQVGRAGWLSAMSQ